MAVGTNTVFVFMFLYFEAIHGFPISDNTLYVSKSAKENTWSDAEGDCARNHQRLASARIADVRPKLRDETENTTFWVANEAAIAKETGAGRSHCPVIYYYNKRLYLKHVGCNEEHRHICMPLAPTDYSLLIYIGVGCITLVQIFLITVCAIKFSRKKEMGPQQTKKTPQKDKPRKEKPKAEKVKKPKPECKEKKTSKKKASKGKDKEETQGIETNEQKADTDEGKEETAGTETHEQKASEEGGTDIPQGTEAKPQETDEAKGKEEKQGMETNEQKSETTVKPAGSEVEKEIPLGVSASETAVGDETAKSEFPDPPEFLLNELTSSILADTAIANIVSGAPTDDILSSKTTGDSVTASADVTETTFSTTAASTDADTVSSPPVDAVAVTDVTADTTTATMCTVAPISVPPSGTETVGLGTVETASADVTISGSPADDKVITSGEKQATEAGFLEEIEAAFLPEPPKDDIDAEVTPVARPDPNGLSEDASQDDVNV